MLIAPYRRSMSITLLIVHVSEKERKAISVLLLVSNVLIIL